MQENVGQPDLALRWIAGPAMIGAALGPLGARRGRVAGLLALVAGSLAIESAITRTCPVNELLGIDTS